jgi:hypothetical protein
MVVSEPSSRYFRNARRDAVEACPPHSSAIIVANMPASTVAQYLAALPADRRAALSAVRKVINENLPDGYEEGMQFGMIGWYVPLSLYPAGYGENPKVPLSFVALAPIARGNPAGSSHYQEPTPRCPAKLATTIRP